jgi:3-oxoacyl-[acyl-carrier protein] reductase
MNLLVTGGTRGLGLEIVRQQLDAGHKLWVIGRQLSSELGALQSACPERLSFIAADLADPAVVQSGVLEREIGKDQPLDGFVNNAAMAYDDLVTNLDLKRLEEMFRVNVLSPMLLTKWVIRRMLLHRTRGSLVHISSICAHTGYKGLAMYAGSKGALEAFSKNVAREWGSLGIRSNCVVPGFMETDMTASLSADQKQRIYERGSLKQPVQVESVAATVGYLLSAASQSITGQEFVVDAGTC